MSFNIKKRALSETTFVHLCDPETGVELFDDDKQAVGITICGKASAEYRDAIAELSRKGLTRKNRPQSFDTQVKDNVDILVSISKSATFEYEGVAVDTAEMFNKLYSDRTLFWIKDAVQEALEDAANFTQK